MKEKIKNFFGDYLKSSNAKFCSMLLFLTVILFIYCYFGSYSFFENTFSSVKDLQFWKIIYHNLMAFVLFFGIGSACMFFPLKENYKSIGLGVGKSKLGITLCLIATPICVLLGLSCVLDGGMSAMYPLIDFNAFSQWYYILSYFASYALYYIGWEFLFRGIALKLSNDAVGKLGAILITTLISALIHTSIAGFGKPMVETLSAIFAGIIFATITTETKSIWYSFYIHLCVGFFTDMFVFLLAV